MIEYLALLCLLLLTIGHGILIVNCKSWSQERTAFSSMLDDRLATLATLIDEGIDMVNGGSTAPIAEAMPDLKELLTVALLNRFTIGSEHGSEKEPKDRQVSENNPSQKKEAESQPIERSTDSSPIEHID